MTSAVSKEEYLKRYLSGAQDDSGKKKKKKKKHRDGDFKPAIVVPRMRIVDTDVDVPSALSEAPTVYTVGDGEETADIEELPVVAAVEDNRDLQTRVDEEFKKSGKWRTFTGEDIARKNLINEVIKLEQANLKDEPMDEEEMSEFLKSQKKKDKKPKVKVEVKEEPMSPLRGNEDSDNSPPRGRRRHDSDSDESPPRRRHDSDGSSSSPETRRRHDSDASPPRKRKDSDSDASPPRKRVKDEPDSDASPPRRTRKDSDSDLSPARRGGAGAGSDSDLSPPRVGEGMGKNVKKTLDGKKAGLQNARDLKEELKMLKDKERRKMEALSDEVSGRNAETKIRGRLAEKEAKLKAEKEKKEVPEEIKEKFQTWNRGVAQVKAAGEKMESDLHEMSKPLTRGVDDEDRENHLKDVEHADDPMLQYMRKKRSKIEGKVKRMPQYQGPSPAPNRFNIRPGYRWDGVDRSNGFEQKLLTQGVNKMAKEEEAYKWSTEDM